MPPVESSREEKSRVESSRVVVNSTASLTFGTNAKWKLNDDKFATSRNLTTDCRRTGVPQNRTYLHTRMPFEAHSVVSNLIRCETFVKAIYAENSAPRPGRQISGLPRFFHIQPPKATAIDEMSSKFFVQYGIFSDFLAGRSTSSAKTLTPCIASILT